LIKTFLKGVTPSVLALLGASFTGVDTASALTILAADNGLNGSDAVVSFSPSLARGSALSVGAAITGLAADSSGTYVALANIINKYDAAGTVIANITSARQASFDALAASGGLVYAAANLRFSGVQGYVSFNQNLILQSEHLVPNLITGITADSSGVYVASSNIINKYDAAGAISANITSASQASFDALAASGSLVYAAANLRFSGVQGYVSFNQNLILQSEHLVPNLITGITTDSSGVYLAMSNSIVEYDFSGNVLASYTGSASDYFTALAISPAPAPETGRGELGLFSLLAAGCIARRRVSAC